MTCPGCGRDNRPGARFCSDCGTALVPRCPACATELPADARFCDTCGTSVAGLGALVSAAARKVVTIVFADLAGSTSLQEALDPESVRRLMDEFNAALRGAVEDHGGTVVKFTGDGLMAGFGVRAVAEDDAWRAIRAAAAMQDAFAALGWDAPVSLRVGVNTGEVIVTEGQTDVVGDAVNVAARLEAAAGPGGVLVGEETWRLTRHDAEFEAVPPLLLRGKSEPVPAYRLVAVTASTGDAAAPFVGRDAELATLTAALDEVVTTRAARLVTVLGSPGLGKSRLAAEFASEVAGRASVLEARFSATVASTFAPLLEALAEEGIADALTGSPQEAFLAVRRALEARAESEPVVLVLEDLHWAEPLMLDLVEHLVEWTSGPVLLLALARPELREMRPALVETTGRATDVLVLEGLDPEDSEQLACDLLETDELPPAFVGRIIGGSEGNPLFVRELVRMLVDDGVLRRHGDTWLPTIEIDAITVPPTIQSLLAARVERLTPDERTVLECAAVVGREFYRGAVAELLPAAVRNDLGVHLERLRQKEMVEPAGTYWIDEPVLRFHHVLLRDAAYRRLLKEVRAELHERYAHWLEAKVGKSAEHDDVLGYHFESAHQYRVDLGAFGEHTAVLGRAAATRLASAGRRALDRDDLPAAAGLLGRALARVDGDDPERALLLIDQCEALVATGELAAATLALRELEELSAGSPRLRAWTEAFSAQLAILTDPGRLRDTANTVERAAAELAKLGDAAGAAKAHAVHAAALARLGRIGECEAALDRALAAAREARDSRRATAALAGAPLAALWGPSPVARASGRCLDVVRVLRITTSATTVEATSLRCQAVLEALRGRAGAARRMVAAARRSLEELGHRHGLLSTEMFAGLVELLDDDAIAAESYLRTAHDGFRDLGVDADTGQAAALLARALLAQGRLDEADALTIESERLGGADLKTAIAWRTVRAEVLARRGSIDAALEQARAAVALAEPTDQPLDQADTHLALATVLKLAGSAAEAAAAATRAVELYERKGASVLAERAGRLLQRIPNVATPSAAPQASRRRRIPATAATRTIERALDALHRGDPKAYLSLFAEDAVLFDHMHSTDANAYPMTAGWATLRWEQTDAIEIEPLAALGDRHALARCRMPLIDDLTGPADVEDLRVFRMDSDARIAWQERFRIANLHLATARLIERYAETEASPEAQHALEVSAGVIRDSASPVETLPLLPEDAVLVDHRPAGLGTLHGRDEIVAATRALADVAGDVASRLVDVLGLTPELQLIDYMVQARGADFPLLVLLQVGPDGLPTLLEWFPPEQLDAALDRFDELAAGEPRPGDLQNQASAVMDLIVRALGAGDEAPLIGLAAHELVVEDRRSGLRSTVEGGAIDIMRTSSKTALVTAEARTLAIRGDDLALSHLVWHGADEHGSPFEVGTLQLNQLDEAGRLGAVVIFDPDELVGAVAELDQRYRRGEGAPYGHVLAALAGFAGAFAERDTARLRAVCHPDFRLVDHRPVGWGEIDVDDFVRLLESLFELTPDFTPLMTAFPRMSDCGAVVTMRGTGHDTPGSTFEIANCQVFVVDAGLIAHQETFPVEQLDVAIRRFDELTARRARPLDNAVVRASALYSRYAEAGDWDRFAELFHPDADAEDRRPGFQLRGEGRDYFIRNAREIAAVAMRHSVPLATRGERLALFHSRFTGRNEEFEVEVLEVGETDATGLLLNNVVFETSAVDDAFEELDARFERGEAAPFAAMYAVGRELVAAWSDRDWARMRSVFTHDGSVLDHRPLGWGSIDADAFVDRARSLAELVPDASLRGLSVEAFNVRGTLGLMAGRGTDSHGSRFEMSMLALLVVRDDHLARVEFFAPEDLDHALRRFEALTAPTGGLSNRALEVARDVAASQMRQDWEAASRRHAVGVHLDDRRFGYRLEVETGDEMTDVLAMLADVDTIEMVPLATRGERLCLVRSVFSGNVDDGPFELEVLELIEIDEDDLVSADISFDPSAYDPAFAELDKRYEAGEGAPYEAVHAVGRRSYARWTERDWEGLLAAFTDDGVMVDARTMGWGEVTPAEFVERLRVLAGMVPNAVLREIELVAINEGGSLTLMEGHGTGPDGGDIEITFHGLIVVKGDRVLRLEFFDADARDAAVARFAALTAGGSPEPIGNRAIEVERALNARVVAHDWEGAAALLRDDLFVDDRRAALRSSGRGKAAFIASSKAIDAVNAMTVTPIATRGQNLSLAEVTMTGTVGGGSFELAFIVVLEIDEADLVRTLLAFDTHDVDTAFAELDRLFSEGQGRSSQQMLAPGIAFMTTMAARDWPALRATLADDLVVVDHRPTPLPTRGRDEYVASAEAMARLAPDTRLRTVDYPRIGRRGLVQLVEQVGTYSDGSRYERLFAAAVVIANGRIARMEFYPGERVADAIARHEDLERVRLDNGATRFLDGFTPLVMEQDWDAVVSRMSPAFEIIDQRPSVRFRGDRDGMIDNLRAMVGIGAIEWAAWATRGERLCLTTTTFRGGGEVGGEYEVVLLTVHELDTDCLYSAQVSFEPGDLDAAFDELDRRFAASEAAGAPGAWTTLQAVVGAHATGDFEQFAAQAQDVMTVVDHRRLGWGEMSGGTFQAFSSAGVVGSRMRCIAVPRISPEGICALLGASGTVGLSGGDWENEFVVVARMRGHTADHLEFFDPEDLDDAVARYEELTDPGGASEPLQNRAYEIAAKVGKRLFSGDMDGYATLFAPNAVVDDRRSELRTQGHWPELVEMLGESLAGVTRIEPTVVATRGDRLMLMRLVLGGDTAGGPFEVEFLAIIEIDSDENVTALIFFDGSALDAAYDELDRRFAAQAGEAS